MTKLDLETVDHLLTTTRAVRKRLDFTRPVPHDVILECLRLAVQAPTGSNAQLWRWLVIDDPVTLRAIADLYQNPPATPRGPGEARPEQTPQQQRVMESAFYLRDHIHEVPMYVIPCTQDKGGAAGWQPSMYPAVWSFILALRSRGLGSVITTVHLNREREAAELLGVPDGYVQSCLLPVAYFTGDDFKPAVRGPVEDITFWNHWDNTTG
jgi:nitroreductase